MQWSIHVLYSHLLAATSVTAKNLNHSDVQTLSHNKFILDKILRFSFILINQIIHHGVRSKLDTVYFQQGMKIRICATFSKIVFLHCVLPCLGIKVHVNPSIHAVAPQTQHHTQLRNLTPSLTFSP